MPYTLKADIPDNFPNCKCCLKMSSEDGAFSVSSSVFQISHESLSLADFDLELYQQLILGEFLPGFLPEEPKRLNRCVLKVQVNLT